MPNRGALVSAVVPRDDREMFEVTDALEASVGRLVVVRASDDDLAAVEVLHRRMVAHHDGGERAFFDDDQAIHQRFADLTGIRTLAVTCAGFAGEIRRARSFANVSDARWAESVGGRRHRPKRPA